MIPVSHSSWSPWRILSFKSFWESACGNISSESLECFFQFGSIIKFWLKLEKAFFFHKKLWNSFPNHYPDIWPSLCQRRTNPVWKQFFQVCVCVCVRLQLVCHLTLRFCRRKRGGFARGREGRRGKIFICQVNYFPPPFYCFQWN